MEQAAKPYVRRLTMNSSGLHIQTTQNRGEMLSTIVRAASTANYDKLTVLVAYATKIGCEILVSELRHACPNWANMTKTWIISLDFGHTQPEALEYLTQLTKSSVAIPNADLVLKANLRPSIRFHPKLYIFEYRSQNKTAMISGSCNLTYAGLYLNTEQATVYIIGQPPSMLEKQTIAHIEATKKLIQYTCSSATPLTSQILSRYRSLWHPDFLPSIERKPSSTILSPDPSIDEDKAMALSTASNFWIRVTPKVVQNRGPDKPGNQIDMQRGARVFFGFEVANVEVNTHFGAVVITFQRRTSSHQIWYGSNGMDKIALPPLRPSKTYANRTLLFRRLSNNFFELVIGTSRQASEWRILSLQQHGLFKMQSGREFGVFE
jgi:HKD family nuclease